MTKDIDDLLRDDGQRWRSAQTTHPRPASSYPEAGLPSLRRPRLSPIIAAAIVPLFAVATVVGIQHHRQQSSGGTSAQATHVAVVPWKADSVSQLATGPALSSGASETLPRADNAVPTCDNRSFIVRDSTPPAATFVSIMATYNGSTACRISGFGPSVVIASDVGTPILNGSYTRLDYRPSLLVKPGQVVRTGAVWYSWCGGALPGALSLSVDLQAASSGQRFTAPIPTNMQPPPCEPTTHSSDLETFPTTVVGADSLDNLTAIVSAPASAKAGSVLTYTVELRNLTASTVALRPCPSFEEGLLDPNRGVILRPIRAKLNCDQAPTGVQAGGQLVLDMQLAIPGSVNGHLKLAWTWAGQGSSDFEIYTYPAVEIIA